MRFRVFLSVCLLVFASSAFAKEVYLSIGGSVGVFHTDARIFNPSTTKDIQIQAYLLPAGTTAIDNSNVQPITITVPKRQMAIYNDVVQSLFNNNSTPLAAIRLVSSDDFVATQRIYALDTSGCGGGLIQCTLGQFVPGLDVTTAVKQGVLIQLKSSNGFRTNIGLVNPNATAANVTWHLYDKNSASVSSVNASSIQSIPPFGVIQPSNMTTLFSAPGADLSDAWVSFTSDQPIFAYGSVVDNGTSDPTFIPVSFDSGGAAVGPTSKTFNVTEQNFSITISPPIGVNDLKPNDVVTFHISVRDSSHGFELLDPSGTILIPSEIFSPGATADKSFTVTTTGTYSFFCTNSSCGAGHSSMSGTFIVGQPTPTGPSY